MRDMRTRVVDVSILSLITSDSFLPQLAGAYPTGPFKLILTKREDVELSRVKNVRSILDPNIGHLAHLRGFDNIGKLRWHKRRAFHLVTYAATNKRSVQFTLSLDFG